MKRTGRVVEKRGAALRAWIWLLFLLVAALPATAKLEVDFDPNLDFSQFKTHAYIENPDLLVRYWANSQVQVNVAATGNWGPYGPYLGTYWGFLYDTMSASSTREAMLVLDLIDAKNKDLA